MRILVIDDDEILCEMLEHALMQAGYEVETATNGSEGLEILRRGDCRLVISDWEMPVMDGIELCRHIRGGEFPSYIYAILLTSHESIDETVKGLAAGADDFIKKPFNPAELVLRVRAGERVLSLESRDITIFALARLAESRDPDTGTHLERVRNYCRILATHLATLPEFQKEVTANFVRLLYATSPLHDIGKVGIPDSVLLKPGLLSTDEFELMKSHTTLGADTLGDALKNFPHAEFLHMARDIAATHHERWDGSGYPYDLKGEQIPLCGRIVALADVYDALSSKRVYKAAYSHDVARSIIVEGSGKHFDARIVEAFLACEQQFLKVRNQYSEDRETPEAELVGADA